MSNTNRGPFYTHEQLTEVADFGAGELEYVLSRTQLVRDYEAARAKDAELIQQLVDALEWVAAYNNGCPLPTWENGYNNAWSIANSARAAAKAAGFKPSEQ